MKKLIQFCILLFVVSLPVAKGAYPVTVNSNSYNVRDYGAVGDGKTMDTKAINGAIQACREAGGGTVFLPAGTYLTGSIHLVSNLILRIDPGATILGSKNPDDYQATRGPADGPKFLNLDNEVWYQSLIIGKGVHHVSIIGPGLIDGNKVFNRKGEAKMRGPQGILLEDCRNITLRDIEVKDASNYAILLLYCTVVNCEGLVVTGGWDGIHIRDVKNCTINNCSFMSGDDAIAGWNLKNIVISNCIINTACNSFRLGGQDILINNCVVYGPGESEDITSRRRFSRGFLYHPSTITDPRCPLDPSRPLDDNIVLSDITMTNMRNPYWLVTGNRKTGRFRISNLTAIGTGRSPIYASGEAPVQSLVLENVRMGFIGEGTEPDANDNGFLQTSIMQFYGFHASNVRNIEFLNVTFELENPDLRPAFFAEKAETIVLDRFKAGREKEGSPSIHLSEVKKLVIDGYEMPLSKAEITGLKAGTSEMVAGKPYFVTVTARNAGKRALVRVPISAGGVEYSRDVLFDTGEEGKVSFIHLKSAKPGDETVQSGVDKISFKVLPAPVGHPVEAPFLAFKNSSGNTLQYGKDKGFVQASCDYVAQDRIDQYGAMYLKGVLETEGTIIARFDTPVAGNGRGGIIVRNDISKAGEAKGMVLLDLAPVVGPAMQWDSDGDGRVDLHTPIDGYTTWPIWLKMTRVQESYIGYYSSDGIKWVKIAEVKVPGSSKMQDAGIYAHNIGINFTDFKVTSDSEAAKKKTPVK